MQPLTLVSTSVQSFTLLSDDSSPLRLLTLDMDMSLLTLVLDTPIWPPLSLPREAMRVDRRVLSLVAGVLGRECLSTSTSVNWTEVPPPLVRWMSPCKKERQYKWVSYNGCVHLVLWHGLQATKHTCMYCTCRVTAPWTGLSVYLPGSPPPDAGGSTCPLV